VRIRCTLRLAEARRVQLVRNGVTVARGHVGPGGLVVLTSSKRIKKGRYSLLIGKIGLVVVVR
jgi:hypothetical protein